MILLLALAASGCSDDNPPLPFIRVTSIPATARVTTNNARNQVLTISGSIDNMQPNRPASIQVVNNLGAPEALPLPIGTGGVFSFQINGPLTNAGMPLLPGPTGNSILIRASNDFSPLDSTGNPIPTIGAINLIIDNQIVFTHPAYADLVDDDMDLQTPPVVQSECDLTSPMNVVSGTFSVPAGTVDANNVITMAELVQRDDGFVFQTPETDIGMNEDHATITINADGTFEHTLIALGNCGNMTPANCNFFVRFSTNSVTARALLGSFDDEVTMTTYPFTDCAVD